MVLQTVSIALLAIGVGMLGGSIWTYRQVKKAVERLNITSDGTTLDAMWECVESNNAFCYHLQELLKKHIDGEVVDIELPREGGWGNKA